MAKQGKQYVAAAQLVDRNMLYNVDEAITLARKASYAKFNASVELSFRLNVDPRHADQQSVEQLYCHTVQDVLNASWSSHKVLKKKKLSMPAQISSVTKKFLKRSKAAGSTLTSSSLHQT